MIITGTGMAFATSTANTINTGTIIIIAVIGTAIRTALNSGSTSEPAVGVLFTGYTTIQDSSRAAAWFAKALTRDPREL